MDKNIDKMVDAAIEEAFIQQWEKYNYDKEMENAENECCEECEEQEVYFLRR